MARPLGLGLCVLLLLACAAAPPATAVGPRRASSAATLQQLSRHAGFIFRGRVLRVERLRGGSGSPATVQVTFLVIEGIRGTRSGDHLTIREWAGAWAAGRPRYRAGQELLLFLYPLSRMGLTSPVGGEAGILPLDAQLPAPALAAPPAVTPGRGPRPAEPARAPGARRERAQ